MCIRDSLKGDQGTKTINLEAHDAGLKGTLTNNGDGTTTFTMDALKGGDKISIGGKQYTICLLYTSSFSVDLACQQNAQRNNRSAC